MKTFTLQLTPEQEKTIREHESFTEKAQVFGCPNGMADRMRKIGEADGKEIFYCPAYDYYEVF